jgi:methyl-accepting chemotaxis protein
MRMLENMKVGSKLVLAFGVMIALTAALGSYSLYRLRDLNAATFSIRENWLPSIRYLGNVNTETSDYRVAQLELISASGDEAMAKQERATQRLLDTIEHDDAAYAQLMVTPEEHRLHQSFASKWKQYLDDTGAVASTAHAGHKDEALALLGGKNAALFADLSRDLSVLEDENVRGADDAARLSRQTYDTARELVLAVLVVALIIGGLLASVIARHISRPAAALAQGATRLAEGDLSANVALESRDEMGEIASSFRALNQTVGALVRETTLLLEAARSGQIDRRSDVGKFNGAFRDLVEGLNDLIMMFVQPIVRIAPVLSSASHELAKISQEMSASAEQTANQAGVASAAVDQVSKSVQMVSASSEEMISSIREIARAASEAARVASAALRSAESTNTTIAKLGSSSREIGQVIKVITAIAQQTKLLAVNATIEAARAGEAGKGFAVVANEVKELAKQTAQASEDISQRIESIQGDAEGAIGALADITRTIQQIHEIQMSVASAVEEQTTITKDIGRNVSEAARSSIDIARNVQSVAEAGRVTASGSLDIQKAAREVAQNAEELLRVVTPFRATVRPPASELRPTDGHGVRA